MPIEPMSAPLTKIELDITTAAGCQHPDCRDPHCGNEMFVHGRCHPGAAVEVRYVKGSGVLNVRCRKCSMPIINVKVAES